MKDKGIRITILKFLKSEYDESPHNSYNGEIILKNLGLEEKELIRNIKYLEEKGLIDVQWFLGGNFIAKINSYGIDSIEENEIQEQDDEYPFIKEGKAEQKDTSAVLPYIIEETRYYVESKLKELCPEVLDKLQFIYEDLLTRTKSHNFARITYDLREILKDFTDKIFKDEYLDSKEEKPNREKTKNKIRFFLKAKTKSETTSRLISERFDYIMNYFDTLSDDIQKKAHPDKYEVTSEDAKSCLIYTYMFIRDILKIIEIDKSK